MGAALVLDMERTGVLRGERERYPSELAPPPGLLPRQELLEPEWDCGLFGDERVVDSTASST